MNELEEKTERIMSMLATEQLDAVLLNAQHNFAWLSGGGTNGIDLSRENGAASLLVTRQGKRFVIANNIEIPRMLAEEVSKRDFDPIDYPWQEEKGFGDLALQKTKSLLGNDLRIATDIPLFADAKPIENKIAACRSQLTISEVERFKMLGHDAGVAMMNVIAKLKPGDSEFEIAEKIRHELAVSGMTSVVTLVAADERISQFRHPVPTGNIWKKTLLMVTCAKRYGLIASLSRIVCLGSISDDLRQRTEAAAYVNACMLDATRAGATGAEIYAATASAYTDIGFADEINRHHQGGAAGYKTREWVAHPTSAEIVKVNQAFAWNPSITGTKSEETCIVSDGGIETITTSPDFPAITSTVKGHEYSTPGIFSI